MTTKDEAFEQKVWERMNRREGMSREDAIVDLVNNGEISLWEEPTPVKPSPVTAALAEQRHRETRIRLAGGDPADYDEFESAIKQLREKHPGMDREAAISTLVNRGALPF